MKIAIVGAGFAGLAAAYELTPAHQVTVLEAGRRPGGLAAGFKDELWDWPLEHFYHHLFTSDDAILGLARATGFGDKLITRRPITASWHAGGIHALDGVGPVLKFPGIPFHDRVRLGLVVAYLKVTRDWQRLENVTAADWLTRWMGRRTYEVVWQPLLYGKFGDRHASVPMSWMWARLHKRSMRLVYFEGGFQAFADHLAQTVIGRGAEVRYGVKVEHIGAGSAAGEVVVRADGADTSYDHVIVTTGPHLLARMAPELPADYLAGLNDLPYLGAIVAVLALREQVLEKVYWLSMDKREFPFLALVEHTNFMDTEHYAGDRVVYVGDYLPPDHPAFAMTDEELLDWWLPFLGTVHPGFTRASIRRSWVFRASYAQPVVPLGFSRRIPALQTPIPGLLLASMSQVYPWDRGTNYAVEIGQKAARKVIGGG